MPQMPLTQLPSHLQSPYQAYVYSYPHKTAYRPFPARSLSTIWAPERRDALFLYIHIPFCEMRCGFCNLFTTVNHNDDVVNHYVDTLKRQAQHVKTALEDTQFARLALGGGTPTQLSIVNLEAIFDIATDIMKVNLKDTPISVEVSPETATFDKLQLLRDRYIDRISIGVQSFIDQEVLATQRRQTSAQVQTTLNRIREIGFPILNIDLIYGLPGQTVDTWLQSIRTALQFQPEELYLYPLYVRPLTGLGLSDRQWDDYRLTCYRAGRDFLQAEGYTQVSMRMFRAPHAVATPRPVYCCQADGMVGLGCGARSYTRSLHYSNEYAINTKTIRSIIDQYITTDDATFDVANYGFALNLDEQKRRFILLSFLSEEGLDSLAYCDRFHTNALSDFPQLQQLIDWNLAQLSANILHLTELGLERSDAIGPWLFSPTVHQLMQTYPLK
jgi:oxygen-independent coproporphyrinogen-3 oxidase